MLSGYYLWFVFDGLDKFAFESFLAFNMLLMEVVRLSFLLQDPGFFVGLQFWGVLIFHV